MPAKKEPSKEAAAHVKAAVARTAQAPDVRRALGPAQAKLPSPQAVCLPVARKRSAVAPIPPTSRTLQPATRGKIDRYAALAARAAEPASQVGTTPAIGTGATPAAAPTPTVAPPPPAAARPTPAPTTTTTTTTATTVGTTAPTHAERLRAAVEKEAASAAAAGPARAAEERKSGAITFGLSWKHSTNHFPRLVDKIDKTQIRNILKACPAVVGLLGAGDITVTKGIHQLGKEHITFLWNKKEYHAFVKEDYPLVWRVTALTAVDLTDTRAGVSFSVGV